MCCIPFAHLWSCCCDRRKILEDAASPPRSRSKSRTRKPKSLKHHRNTRVRIARDTGASSVSARRSQTSTHRRHSYNPEKRSRSRSVGADADGRIRSSHSHSHSHRRSRSGVDGATAGAAATDLSVSERARAEKRARRRSGSNVDGRAAAERALSGVTGFTTSTDSQHRRAKVSAANSHLGYGESHLGEKRHSTARRGSHDDSGYRTEERRASSGRASAATAANRRDLETEYRPRAVNGNVTTEQDSRAGILKGRIVNMLGKRNHGAGREEVVVVERPKSSRYRTRTDEAAAGYAIGGQNGNGNDVRAGMVNMLDHDTEHSGGMGAGRRNSRKDAAHRHRSKGEVSEITAGVATMVGHESSRGGSSGERKHGGHRHRSKSDAMDPRANMVNMLDHDDDDDHDGGDRRSAAATSKLSRSKSASHRSSRGGGHRSSAVNAAEATGSNGDVLRRRSARKKPILLEDVDPNYHNPDDDTDKEYVVSSDDAYIDGMQKPRPAAAKTRKKAAAGSASKGSVGMSRADSKSNGEASRTEVSSEARRRRAKSTKKQKNKATSTGAETKGAAVATAQVTLTTPTPPDTTTTTTAHRNPGLTRQQAQAADPRSRTEYMLFDVKKLAAEALHRPGIQRRHAYHTTDTTTTAVASSAVLITRPTFTYREDSPLPQTEADHYATLTSFISRSHLQALFPSTNPHPRQIARKAAADCARGARAPGICEALELSRWALPDLALIGLYDVIVFCDDSGSMNIEERYGTLRTVVRRIARIAGAYNPRGIKIRFVNATNDGGFDGIVTEEQVETCLDTVVPKGGTQLGTRLVTKVIQPLILDRARRGELDRPVVVIIVTDGEPSGEDEDMLKNAILATKNELSKHSCGRSSYGPSSVVFHIARVGTSSKAKSFVRSLEEDEEVNDLLFSTDESLDWALGEAQSRGQLNTWLLQLLAGSIKL